MTTTATETVTVETVETVVGTTGKALLRAAAKCANPKVTSNVFNAGYGTKAYCPGCKEYQPAKQVSWNRMRYNRNGVITATYAPLPH